MTKLEKILAGEEVICSEPELAALEKLEAFSSSGAVSIYNPNQVGFLDAFIVGKTTCPTINKWRVEKGLE